MRVPCPVPPQAPWSPVGYQVVQVADEQTLVPPAAAQPDRPEPARSPVGYRVVQVADERSAGAPRPPARRARRAWPPPSEAPRRLPPWGAVVAGGFGLMALVVLLGVIALALGTPDRPPSVAFAPPPQGQKGAPPAPAMVMGGGAANPGGACGPKVPVTLPAWPAAADKDRPEKSDLPAEGVCKAGAPAGRETFGTAVAFARNPREAARAAAVERKLTCFLHVSGDFEDARFT
jgi:hypothetical protein